MPRRSRTRSDRARRRVGVLGLVAAGVVLAVGLGTGAGGAQVAAPSCTPGPEVPPINEEVGDARVRLITAPLAVHLGTRRGAQTSEADLPIKDPDGTAPKGPVSVRAGVFQRDDGGSIPPEALEVSALAVGDELKVRLCVDAEPAAGIVPGTYHATVDVIDDRFEHHKVAAVVSLQSPRLWDLALALALTGGLAGLAVAFVAARGGGQTRAVGGVNWRAAIHGPVAWLIVLFSAPAGAAVFRQAAGDPGWGATPIDFFTLSWQVGAATMAAATVVLAGDKGLHPWFVRSAGAAPPATPLQPLPGGAGE